jgi:hypothetical protein
LDLGSGRISVLLKLWDKEPRGAEPALVVNANLKGVKLQLAKSLKP